MLNIRLSYNNKEFTMLDYMGSITMDKDEINNIIIRYFQSQMNESGIVKMIEKYRRLEFIEPEYSVSGWHMFHSRTVIDHFQEAINKERKKIESFLALIYSLENSYDIIPHDLHELIYKKYKKLFINNIIDDTRDIIHRTLSRKKYI